MKKTVYICLIVAIASFIAGFIVCQNTIVKKQNKIIKTYNAYNKSTEEFLDTLENDYNWIDVYDPYDYYESRAKLDTLLYNIK